METLLFIITRPFWATWWARAAVIAVAASAVLNLSPRLPWLKDIETSRINARWVGYAGLTFAFAVWTAFNLNERGWFVFAAWTIIAVATLIPNTLVHWRAESVGGKDNRAGNVKVIEFRLTDRGEALLERYLEENSLDDPELARLFKLEQRRETAQERWENVLLPKKLLGLLDEAIACIAKAVAEDNPNWLYTAAADVQEAREAACKSKYHIHLFYRLFCPEHAA